MWRDDRAVATTEGDIAEVLEAETLVDMQKLRELSTHGIPNNLRARRGSTCSASRGPRRTRRCRCTARTSRSTAARRGVAGRRAERADAEDQGGAQAPPPQLPFFRDARTRQRLERLLRAFLHGSAAVEFRPGLVHLLGPLVHVYAKNEEVEAFFCFQELMGRLLREKLLTFEGASGRR